ncbi:MAG TPA: ROK family protein [Burkholderiaceae bacterium]
MKQQYIAGLDIGGTKIAAIVANADGVLARVMELTVKTGSPDALGRQALALIQAACKQAGIAINSIDTFGVSSCGPFAQLDGMRGLAAPNICGGISGRADLPNDWTIIPLEKILREQFGTVVIVNDCVAALQAERTFGALRDQQNCVYATWSTGIGFGICVDGHILHGKHGNAGHAGHMLMDIQSNAICGCGNRGDLEAMISGRNINNQFGITSSDLFASASAGNTAAREVAVQTAQWFGRALYNLAVTLDTCTFAIGGSVWNNHAHWLAPIVQQEITSRMPALTRGVSILPAALGALTTDIGALSLVMPPDWIERWKVTTPWVKVVVPFSSTPSP